MPSRSLSTSEQSVSAQETQVLPNVTRFCVRHLQIRQTGPRAAAAVEQSNPVSSTTDGGHVRVQQHDEEDGREVQQYQEG